MIVKKTLLGFCAVLMLQMPCGALECETKTCEDGAGLENMIITLLMPAIQGAVSDFYEPYLTVSPTVVSYYGTEIVRFQGGELLRDGYYSSRFSVTVDVLPYVGPHLTVGKDRITVAVRPDGTTEIGEYHHLESHSLTPAYQTLLKKPLP